MALAIDYFYQMTFFLSVVTLLERRKCRLIANLPERRLPLSGLAPSKRSFVLHWVSDTAQQTTTTTTDSNSRPSSVSLMPMRKTTSQLAPQITCESVVDHLLDRWIRIVHTNRAVKLGLFSTFVAHILASVYLCTENVAVGSVANQFLTSSPLNRVIRANEAFILNDCYTVAFHVATTSVLIPNGTAIPSNISSIERGNFKQMVHELETIAWRSYGEAATRLWWRRYEDSVTFLYDPDVDPWSLQEVYKNVQENYIGMDIEPFWFRWISNENQTDVVGVHFWFTVAYHNMTNADDLHKLQLKRREIVDKYPQFQVEGFNDYDVLADSLAYVPVQLSQMTGGI